VSSTVCALAAVVSAIVNAVARTAVRCPAPIEVIFVITPPKELYEIPGVDLVLTSI
jgi:hypothetical protein